MFNICHFPRTIVHKLLANIPIAIAVCSVHILCMAETAPVITEADFLAAPLPKGDMTEFLKARNINYKCSSSRREDVKAQFTGFLAFCHTKREWMRPAPNANYGHHNVTRIGWITQYKDGLLDGISLIAGEETKNYYIFQAGRVQLSTFKNKNGNVERSFYEDCLPRVVPNLYSVPADRQYVAVRNPHRCEVPANSVYRTKAECQDTSEGRLDLFNDEGAYIASYQVKDGMLHGLAVEGANVFRMKHGREVAYAAFDPRTCRILPESDPKKRTAKFDPKNFLPSTLYLPIYRPDQEAANKRQQNVSRGVSLFTTPIKYLSAPVLIWLAPDWYPDFKPAASASYFLRDKYWEFGLGVLSFKTRDWSAYGYALHYTYKKIDKTDLWGLRVAGGGGVLYLFGAVQTGLTFSDARPAQWSLDLCALPVLSVCFGTRLPLSKDAADIEAPFQLSLKLGF